MKDKQNIPVTRCESEAKISINRPIEVAKEIIRDKGLIADHKLKHKYYGKA